MSAADMGSNSARSPPLQAGCSSLQHALREAGECIAAPQAYAQPASVDAAFKLLRQHSPVHRVEAQGICPFWAITRHADVLAIEQLPQVFVAAQRTIVFNEFAERAFCQLTGREPAVRPLTHMDDPDHRVYRAIARPFFSSANLSRLKPLITRMARDTVDELARAEGNTCDFAASTAVFPLRVILAIIGVPEEDLPLMLEVTRNLFGVDDGSRRTAEEPNQGIASALRTFRDYFDRLTASRRARPQDDLASVIANATIDGAPVPEFERISYFLILMSGGHETTSLALASGMHALLQHPQQLERLRREPELLNTAIEEILRWSSPTRHFMRTAAETCEIAGTRLQPGDAVALFFCSANRDERVFADADSFICDRAPNPHLAFGHGAHYCLGHRLAKMELHAFLRELFARLESIAPAGAARWAQSNFMGGVTALPIRCSIRAGDIAIQSGEAVPAAALAHRRELGSTPASRDASRPLR